MIEAIQKEEEKIRAIWLEHKDTMPLKRIFDNFLGSYFEIVISHIPIKGKVNKDWLFFLGWVKKWRKEEREKEIARDLENTSDEQIEEVQSKNRKRMILMLKRILDDYETKPKLKKLLDVGEIRRMYKAIQSLEEVAKRTEIARGKLKLDAVRTLLPYKRMSPEELIALRDKLNESFERILKLKEGEPVGGSAPDSG